MLSQAIRPPRRSVIPRARRAPSRVVRIDFGDREQLALAAELALEGRRLLAQALGGVGVGHRLGGEARVDHEQAQVVVVELVEPQLREDERRPGPRPRTASARAASTRRGRPRCPGSCWPAGRRRHPAGSGRCGCAATQPVMPWPSVDLELVGRLVHVLADLALHRDRDEVARRRAGRRGRCGSRSAGAARSRWPCRCRATLVRRLSRAPSCWIDWSWAAQVAMRWKFCAVRIATLACVARAAIVSSSSGRPWCAPVVVDVEQAEQLGAVQERRGADRCRSLPGPRPRGCPRPAGRRGSRTREERPSRGHRGRRQRVARRDASASR